MYLHIINIYIIFCTSLKKRKKSTCHLMAQCNQFRLKGNYIVTENIVYLNINFNLSRNEKKIKRILCFVSLCFTSFKVLLAI